MEATASLARQGISTCAGALTACSAPLQRTLLRALVLSVALFAVLAAASAQSASACVAQPFTPAPLTNNFEGADGDQCDSDGAGPKRDWQNVVGEDGFVGTDDEPSDADTIYGSNNAGLVPGATDENKPDSWNFTIGNLGGSKFDALSAFSFTDPISDKLFVDLAFVRATATGATFLAFELNQRQPGYRQDANESDPTKPFAVPTRSDGDLLVTYDVNNAGAITLGLCVWDGDEHAGRWEEFTTDLSGDAITNQPCPALSTTLYQAALNDAQSGRQGTIPAAENFLTSGDVGQGRFGEAVVNLTDALRDPANPNGPQSCIDFGYVWMHSRSSDSLTSAQQDFILPTKAVAIGNCSVEGTKFNDANGNGANDGAANGEPGLAGWTIFVDYDGDGVLDNNKDATFVNDNDGVVEAGEEEPYAVTADGTGTEPLGHYRITDVQRTTGAATWQVREVLQPAWDCTAAIGGGAVAGCPEKTDTNPDTALGFQLAWLNNDIHTGRDFGNRRQPATLKVVKHVVNDNGGTAVAGDWSLHVKDGGSEVAGSPQAGDENGDVYTLTDGESYDVSETGGPSGYAATFSGDCDANGSVTVAAGVQKTCTITNNDVAPKVTVVKHVVNDNGGTAVAANWDLHLKSGANDVTGSPQAGDENGDTYTVAAGAFKVSETGGPSGYAATFSGDCDADGDITVAAGQEKTCTITNNDVAPTVKVVKHVVNDNGGTAVAANWQLHLKSGANDVTGSPKAGKELGDTYTVAAGSYTVSETGGPSGYAATFSGDCNATGAISVSVGQEKTCTITNNDVAPKVTVVKHVVNDNGGTAVASNWSLHLKNGANEVAGSPQAGDENGDTYTVAAGAYTLSETGGPSGYAATFSGDCNAGGAISVTVGQEKTCTITNNDIAPKVTVVKHVVNDDGGTAVAANWDLHLKSGANDVTGSPQAGDENGDTYTVAAGSYAVSETGGPSGYVATFSGDCDTDGDISVSVGQEKTCTITNNDVAPGLTVIKHVVNDNGGTAVAANWQLHVKSGANDVAGSPKAGNENGDTYTVAAGAYKVSETGGVAGYAATFSGDCDADGDVTVSVGQAKTCTITNNDIAPKVEVVKHVVNDNGGTAVAANWDLHLKSGGNDVTGSPQAGDENGDTYNVSSGAYKVSETGGPSGYAATFSGDCDADGDISVTVGQEKTCTITNDDIAPKVKVVKHVVNDNGGTAVAANWDLHLKSGANDVTGSPQAGDENGDTYTVAAGSYSVSETGGPSGYAATFSGDCDADGDITVSVGQEKSCTITNDDVAPEVKVVKHVVNDDGGAAVAGDWSLHLKNGANEVTGSPQAGDENGDTYTVAAGSYTVSETGGPSGYAATFSGDCNANGDVSVSVGQEKTCTITNNDVAPKLTVVKHVVNKGGSTTQASAFTMDVTATNPSNAHFPGNEAGTTITLNAGQYSVDESGGPSTFVKDLSAGCAGTIAVGQEKTCTITNTKVLPGGVVVKKGPAFAYHGDTLNFTFEVTNPGTTPLTTVNVTDDKCAPVVGPTQMLGGNQDAQLDAGETWVYTCTMTVPAHAAGDTTLVNTVTLAATDADGEPVGDTDQHTTQILHQALAIDKTGPATAQAGQPVLYTLAVTNPGDVAFLAANLSVTDPLCEAPPLLVTKNGDATPGQLDPGDKWTYTCTVRTLVGQTVVNNVGNVSGTDIHGHTAQASDPATTQLTQPPVVIPPAAVVAAGVPVTPSSAPVAPTGTARLSGPSRCVRGPFTVAVRGRNISQVRFTLDGKRLKTVRATRGRAVFSVRINPRRQNYKAHRVLARVTFRASANTPSRTLRFVYLRCAQVTPKFTG